MRNAFISRLMLRLLAPLVILIACTPSRAHANGVNSTISNGKIVTGRVTGNGSDNYTFKVQGGSFVVSISEAGLHDPSFLPMISLTGPGNSSGLGKHLYAKLQQINAPAGTWTVKVSRGGKKGKSGGTYALTLVQVPVAAGGKVGRAIHAGRSSSGSISRGSIDVRTFKGVAGHTATMTVDGGENGLYPDITVFTPTGGLAGDFGCSTSCSQNVSLKTDGVYTVLVSKSDGKDAKGKYTLSVK